MPIRLSDLQKRTRTIPVRFQEEECLVTYRVNALTPAFLTGLVELKTLREILLAQVNEVVDQWDIVNENDEAISPSEISPKLPIEFLKAVVDAISADMAAPGDAEKKA